MTFWQESDETYRTLVAGLAFSILPSAIMGVTLVAIGVFAYAKLGSATILGATLAVLSHDRRGPSLGTGP